MKVSAIIPVLNEQKNIDRIVQHLLNLDEIDLLEEIIVVDGDQNGNTIETMLHKGRKLYSVVSEKGRANQMNKGAHLAKGEVLLFIHADTLIPKNSLKSINSSLEKGYAGGAFSLDIDSEHYFLKLVSLFTNIRSRATKIPYGDQAIFIKKSVFYAVDGYSDMPMLEDVDLMKKIKEKGYKIKILGEKVITSARRWEKNGIYKTTFRNRIIMLLYFFGVKPEKLKKRYRGEDMGENCLMIFVRNPEKGKVKTRLAEDFGEDETLELYKNFIEDIFKRTASEDYEIRVFAWPPGSDIHLRKTFGNDYEYRHQKGGDLGKKMYHAFMETFAEGFQRVILIGSDIPDISSRTIKNGFSELEKKDTVIGPAEDGGYYLIGFNKDKFSEKFFKEIEWGEKTVYKNTIEKFDEISYSKLDTMMDIDCFEDLISFYRNKCKKEKEESYTCKYLKKILK